MILKLTDILEGLICFTNYNKNLGQNYIAIKETWKKSDEVGRLPPSLHFLSPFRVLLTIHQGPTLRKKKKKGGWKCKKTGTKLQRSERETLGSSLFIVSEEDDYKKKPSTPLEKCRWNKRRVAVKMWWLLQEERRWMSCQLFPIYKIKLQL